MWRNNRIKKKNRNKWRFELCYVINRRIDVRSIEIYDI